MAINFTRSIVVIAAGAKPQGATINYSNETSCCSTYIMQCIECPLKWYLRVREAVLHTRRACIDAITPRFQTRVSTKRALDKSAAFNVIYSITAVTEFNVFKNTCFIYILLNTFINLLRVEMIQRYQSSYWNDVSTSDLKIILKFYKLSNINNQ